MIDVALHLRLPEVFFLAFDTSKLHLILNPYSGVPSPDPPEFLNLPSDPMLKFLNCCPI